VAGALTASFDWFHVFDPVLDPITTATYSPPTVNGWFPTNPTVTLTALDRSGLGVASTSYRVDGGQWQAYTAPFVVTGDGTRTVLNHEGDGLFSGVLPLTEVPADVAPVGNGTL